MRHSNHVEMMRRPYRMGLSVGETFEQRVMGRPPKPGDIRRYFRRL